MNRTLRRVLPCLLFAALAVALLILTPPERGGEASIALPVSRSELRTPSPTVTPSPFEQYRQRRAAEREETARVLGRLAEDEGDPLSGMARDELLELARCADAELAIEGAMLGAGYPDAVAVVRRDAATLLVPGARPDERDAAALLLIAVRYTGLAPENIALMGMDDTRR